jgi:hypothetical protein
LERTWFLQERWSNRTIFLQLYVATWDVSKTLEIFQNMRRRTCWYRQWSLTAGVGAMKDNMARRTWYKVMEGRKALLLHTLDLGAIIEALKGGNVAGQTVGDNVNIDVGKGTREPVLELERVGMGAQAPREVARGEGVAEAEDAEGFAGHSC